MVRAEVEARVAAEGGCRGCCSGAAFQHAEWVGANCGFAPINVTMAICFFHSRVRVKDEEE